MLHEIKTPFHTMVDAEKGTVERAIFADQSIYELELERIFARAWNFMCHESQIPKAGDFFLSFIGEESVIATRDKKGELQVLLNSCRHRGNAVCRAEAGNARSFLCTYHGWTYGLDGQLIGVPGYKDFYHEQLDKSQWGLVKAGKVASYKGFVFATMDPEAPDLEEFLGPVARLALDLLSGQGEMMIVEGVQKNIIGCNWKLAVDNLFDFYHVDISHASATMSGARKHAETGLFTPWNHRVTLGDYGHAIGGNKIQPRLWEIVEEMKAEGKPLDQFLNQEWRKRPEVAEALGDMADTSGHPNIFPNMWITGNQICLRLPRGPGNTELWWFTLLPQGLSDAERKIRMDRANRTFGAAGMLEQDDGENWDQSTRATRGVVAQRYPLNFSMAIGTGVTKVGERGHAHIDTHINEHAQLWTYRNWADWMDAESWAVLKAQHTAPPKAGELV
ncbi:aromatic ring-hydroxylating oxygenase subunit alpha [Phenylobacterium immobile]|uniref:aromatic ring-hydroxylating oxygenase subunit alpha n=1 Tax=Phenylobacterium immobile TaxID=21 RepID=UPI000A78E88A|nr:SRPBCC family protein [Phenylobacterium immobile]